MTTSRHGQQGLEHLHEPGRLIGQLKQLAHTVIVSTPNPAVVDVLAQDPDHKTPISYAHLQAWGFHVVVRNFYGQPGDVLFGWCSTAGW